AHARGEMVMLRANRVGTKAILVAGIAFLLFSSFASGQDEPLNRPLRVDPAPVASDKSVKYDYDIVYVRAPRVAPGRGGKEQLAMVWPDASAPFNMRASTDLMLLHADGSEKVLVA